MPKHYSTSDNWFKRHPVHTRTIFIIVALILICLSLYNQFNDEVQNDQKWCEVGTVNADGSVQITSNNEYYGEYVVMARANGLPLVMTLCDRNSH